MKNYHTKFLPNGKFENEFTIEKAGDKSIRGVLGDNILFTELDNMGKMTCSDLNGKYIKTITINYLARDMIPLGDDKIAVVGWVIWAKKFRDLVSIIDYNTLKETVFWDHFTEASDMGYNKKTHSPAPFNYTVKLKSGALISYTSMPFSNNLRNGTRPEITSINNELILAFPGSGNILTYDLNGNLKNKNKINWPNKTISVEEQKIIQQQAIEQYKRKIETQDKETVDNKEAFQQIISQMEYDLNNISTPILKPAFSNIIKDSDGNILFFEMPEEKNENLFHVWVYNQGGEFVTDCTFVCDEYDLNISASKMVFRNGYIYGLQTLKKSTGNPLRLVRFKLEGK